MKKLSLFISAALMACASRAAVITYYSPGFLPVPDVLSFRPGPGSVQVSNFLTEHPVDFTSFQPAGLTDYAMSMYAIFIAQPPLSDPTSPLTFTTSITAGGNYAMWIDHQLFTYHVDTTGGLVELNTNSITVRPGAHNMWLYYQPNVGDTTIDFHVAAFTTPTTDANGFLLTVPDGGSTALMCGLGIPVLALLRRRRREA